MIIHEEQTGNVEPRFDIEFVAIIVKQLEYNCITHSQYQKILTKFSLIKKFNLSQKNAGDRSIIKRDYSRFSPISLNIKRGENSKIFINISGEDSTISLKNIYLEFDFNVTQRAGGHARYAVGVQIGLVNISLIALFIKYRSAIYRGKKIEEIDDALVICSMYNLKSSSKDTDDLSIGSQKCFEARERDLTNNKTTRENNHVRIF